MKTKQKYLPLSERIGPLPYTLQNDYLFKVVLESDERILRSLLCSLLYLEKDEIFSAGITNPIIPGAALDMKTVVLDINLILNNRNIIDLEMQNLNEYDWPERSLTYLCRIFNNIKKGDPSYLSVMPARHIGILDFSLPHLSKEFYSHFYMMNPKTYEIYSDKLCLSVLNLAYRELATEEDKHYGLDKWAGAFLARTWEEFQMLAKENPDFELAADAIYEAMRDANQQEACFRYEMRKAREARLKKELQEKDTIIQERDAALREQAALINKLKKALEESRNQNAEKKPAP